MACSFTSDHHFDDLLFGFFQKRDDLFSGGGREAFEEAINRVALQIVQQRLDGHSRSSEDGRAAHYVGDEVMICLFMAYGSQIELLKSRFIAAALAACFPPGECLG